ncbi:GNAT family N-acetyltransferase [Sphingobacterium luzhongxinii]|uniref:GNAT family N-acetyltransferase n=1 Tax=Sphingobacterium luzhongxinii TaxID=2654181 RepID=UPI0013DA9FA9|nr:GNAT family N-acetyltransferase [Sphingobacterium sp. xlx-73]
MSYRLINFQQSEVWTAYVRNAVNYDFYHTWHYHSLEKKAEPFLFVYEESDVFIALPLLKREIENSGLYDLTSVYGYSGPISNRKFADINDQILENFKHFFLNFINTGRYICVFSRLNPFIDQKVLIEKIGGIYNNGKTVYIDLSISIEEQRIGYEKRMGRQIRQLRRMPYIIKESKTRDEVKLFAAMYNENMIRLKAEKSYFFNEDYFVELIKEDNCKLILIYDGIKMICGAIVMCCGGIIRNHLSATDVDYVNQSPSKLLTDEISIIGRKLGMKYFHLGGGLGGREDSLFKFKSSFSNLFLEDSTWRFVSDTLVYNDLVKERKNDLDMNYFPLYRCPEMATK